VRFAAAGDPNGGDLPRWPVYDAGTEPSLEFGTGVRRLRRFDDHGSDLFDRIHAEESAGDLEI